MKKIYTSFLCVFALVATLSAQTTIYDSDFSETSYDDAGVQADLNAHPEWVAGHFNNGNTWNANMAEQILTGSNFAYSILGTPITAVDGDVVTVTTVIMLGFNNQNFDGNTTNMALFGLSPEAAPAASAVLGQQREGVIISTNASASVDIANAGGTGAFATNPSVSQANKSAYEIIMEFTIGADAASSSKSVRIKNVGTVPETSSVESVGGMRQEVYDAITGTGAYYFNWSLGFFQGGDEINRIVQNRVLITKNTPLLSTSEFNAFEFGMYPNPVKDKLYVNTNDSIEKAEVLDLLGRTVLTVTDVNDFIDVSSLKDAMYVVKLTTVIGTSTKKFMKK